MKRIFLFVLTFIFCCGHLFSQPCLPNDITFTTQQQIDDFAANYPGCTQILGNVTVEGVTSNAITSLGGLSQLTAIDGSLSILDNNALTNLNGINNLQTVGGDVRIGVYNKSNQSLLNLEGLNNLTNIGEDLRIEYNPNLININALSALTVVNESLSISGNDALTSVAGLANINSIGNLYISNNNALINLMGLENITSLGDLSVNANDVLTSLTGLDNVSAISGCLNVSHNSLLSSLSELENVTSIGGCLYLNKTIFTSLTGLDNVSSIGGYFVVKESDHLTSLTGLDNLTSINGYLTISRNPVLTSLAGLDNLTSLNGDLKIFYNATLTSITALENIDYTGIADLDMLSNPNLSMCELSNICDYLGSGGSYTIYDNAVDCNDALLLACLSPDNTCSDIIFSSQADVDIFAASAVCDTIFGDVTIDYGVSDISGLSFVTAVMGRIYFNFSSLSSLDGLEQLTYVGGDIVFLETQISDISALDHPIEIGGNVWFEAQNNNLTDCAVQSFCEHIIANGFGAMIFTHSIYSCENSLINCAPAPTTCPTAGTLEFHRSPQPTIFTALYPNCTTYNGDIWTKASPPDDYGYVSLDLPNLHTLNGNLILTISASVSNMGLVHLNGSISTFDDGTLSGTFNFLETIAGGVYVSHGYGSAVSVSCPVLKSIGGSVSVFGEEGEYIDSDLFPALERIEGGLYDCTPYGSGISLSETAFPALKYIGGNIDIDRGTISGLNMLDTIGGSVIIDDCYWLNDYTSVAITGLNELDYVGGGGLNFGEYNCVSDLSGLCNYFNNNGPFSIYENSCSISESDALSTCSDCPTMPSVIGVNSQPIPDGIYQAADEVNSTGTVLNGGTVNFKAGQVILLDNGFTINVNADFSAEIEDCGQ